MIEPNNTFSDNSRRLTDPSGSNAPRIRNCEIKPPGNVFSPRFIAPTTKRSIKFVISIYA